MPAITDRTWAIQIATAVGTDPRIEFLRERLKDFGGGDVLRANLPTVSRALSAIAAQVLPGGARKLTTYADLADLLADCGHALAAEDATALAKRIADEEAARQAAAKAAEAAARAEEAARRAAEKAARQDPV